MIIFAHFTPAQKRELWRLWQNDVPLILVQLIGLLFVSGLLSEDEPGIDAVEFFAGLQAATGQP